MRGREAGRVGLRGMGSASSFSPMGGKRWWGFVVGVVLEGIWEGLRDERSRFLGDVARLVGCSWNYHFWMRADI